MSEIFGPSGWHFARVEAPLSECSEWVSQLLKQLKARTKKSADPLFGCDCIKANRDSSVRFHKINPERAEQSFMQVLQDFPPDDTPALAACCRIVRATGYYRFTIWELPGLTAEWVISEREGQPSSVSWEQSLSQPGDVDRSEWKDLWWSAAKSLGIAEMLREKEMDGFSVPEVAEGNGARFLNDSRGFRVLVKAEAGPKLKLKLMEADSNAVEAIRSQGVAAVTHALGKATRQALNITYRGKENDITRRLNEVLTVCHDVSYVLNDNARDKFYPAMFKPLALTADALLALPAIEVQHETATEIRNVLVTNLVRTANDSWLEFQTTLSPEVFDWIEQTLGCQLDRWQGPAEARWGWYAS